MDFRFDLKQVVLSALRKEGIAHDPRWDDEKLLTHLLCVDFKTIKSDPRRVHRSPCFDAERLHLPPILRAGLDELLVKIEQGIDVRGHQSKLCRDAYPTDGLLAEWNIFHLHLSTQKRSPTDAFFMRTGKVAFAMIHPEDAYFIHILPHGQSHPDTWTRQILLQIVNDNWPPLFNRCHAQTAIDVTVHPSDSELRKLRKNKINTSLNVGGRIISPPAFGIMGDGTPFLVRFRVNKTLHAVEELHEWTCANAARIASELSLARGIAPDNFDFRLIPIPGGWGVQEIRTSKIVKITRRGS